MPFFKFRRGEASSAPPAGSATQVDSVEILRKRAKHRLIGTSVLVLLGVVGFPMLFDTQPRPIPVDIPIEIPGKNTVKPLAPPAAAKLPFKEDVLPSSPPAAVVAPVPPAVIKEVKPEVKAEPKRETKPEVKPDAGAEEKAQAKPTVKSETKPVRKPANTDADSLRAAAVLNGAGTPPPSKSAAAELKGRTVVQVGSFSDAAKVNEVRIKLEKVGLKTHTQIIETKDGKRTRVRVGPFASKAETEKVINKIRALDLPAAVLTY